MQSYPMFQNISRGSVENLTTVLTSKITYLWRITFDVVYVSLPCIYIGVPDDSYCRRFRSLLLWPLFKYNLCRAPSIPLYLLIHTQRSQPTSVSGSYIQTKGSTRQFEIPPKLQLLSVYMIMFSGDRLKTIVSASVFKNVYRLGLYFHGRNKQFQLLEMTKLASKREENRGAGPGCVRRWSVSVFLSFQWWRIHIRICCAGQGPYVWTADISLNRDYLLSTVCLKISVCVKRV